MKITVVVPVYNTGEHIEACIDSLLKQSMPAEDYEVIFVDDGSTDETPARLDEVAAANANVTVIHTPNSGWPGRPRNIGIEHARGKYIYFVDHDDWLGDEALERLYAYAEENGADVVIGKMSGHGGRGVPRQLFLHNRPDAKLGDDPLLTILTPHKLFRKEMLDSNGIRFPEGKRRLEDHLFVMQCYFAARRISVLSDYLCYHWFRHGENASSVRSDPKVYFDSLRDVLDVVETNTEPGDFRDKLLSHWYRGKMLRSVSGRGFLTNPEPNRTETFREVRNLALERFGPGVIKNLSALDRIRSALLTADRLDLLIQLAEWEVELRPEGWLEAVSWRGGELRLRYCVALVDGRGHLVGFDVRRGKPHWRVPPAIASSGVVPASATNVNKALPKAQPELLIRSTDTGEEYLLPVRRTRWLSGRGEVRYMRFVAEASLDPDTLAAGGPVEAGEWLLHVSLRGCGLSLTKGFAGRPDNPPIALAITGAGEPPGSDDERFRAARARRRRAAVHGVLLNPKVRHAEEAVTPHARRLVRRGKRVWRGVARRGRALVARR